MFFECVESIGIENFGPDVAVISCTVIVGEDVREVGATVAIGDFVDESDGLRYFFFELAYIVFFNFVYFVPTHVEDSRS